MICKHSIVIVPERATNTGFRLELTKRTIMNFKSASISGISQKAPLGRLYVYDQKQRPKTFQLIRGVYRIGRDESNLVKILDTLASRHHCNLLVSENGYMLKDLGSKNGTQINGHRIQAYKEHILKNGDEIRIGHWKLVIKTDLGTPSTKTYNTEVEILVDDNAKHSLDLTISKNQSTWLFDNIRGESIDVQERNNTLARLYEVGNIINQQTNRSDLLDRLLVLMFKVLLVDNGTIMLFDEENSTLVPEVARNKHGKAQKITLSKTIAMKVFTNNISVITHDATQDSRFNDTKGSVMFHGIRSAMCVPLASPNKTHGIFYVDTRFSTGVYTEHDLHFFTAIGHQAGIAIENVKLYEEQKRSFESLIEALASTIDARDPMTAGHSERVSEYSLGIAKALNLSETEQELIKYAGFLHDFGKIGVRDAVLMKPGSLSPPEQMEMRQHATITENILSKIRFSSEFQEIVAVASLHHEHIDGSGYPHGLNGDEIPLGAKIIAIADTFDALVSKRHYKPALSVEEAFSELDRCKGTFFDPDIVECFKNYYLDTMVQNNQN